jgi:hypothetical protein
LQLEGTCTWRRCWRICNTLGFLLFQYLDHEANASVYPTAQHLWHLKDAIWIKCPGLSLITEVLKSKTSLTRWWVKADMQQWVQWALIYSLWEIKRYNTATNI